MDEILESVAGEYKIDTDDVDIEIDYEVGGSFTVENSDPTKAEVIIDQIRNSISEQTGVPVSDVDVDFNSDSGLVEYKIKTDSFDDSNDIKENIDTDSFTDNIETLLENIDSNMNVTSPEVNERISADINIVVDAKDSTVDLADATNKLSTEFTNDGFDVKNAKGIFSVS